MQQAEVVAEDAARASPIAVEIIRGALRAMQREMEALIERTAMSPFIREKKDFHTSLFDAAGRLIAGKSTVSADDVVGPVFEHYPAETMRRGDIYWYNDCYASRGAVTHSNDQVFIAPVFHDLTLVGFAHSWAHFNDIGGMRPGSLSPDCTDIFQEGIIIPPVRVARDGVLNEELLRLFFRNSRFPEMLKGDARASLASIRLGERRLEELAARFGSAVLADAFDQLIARTREEALRRFHAIAGEGEHRFTEIVDSDGQGHGPIRIRYDLTVADGRAVLDMTRSDDQVPGPVNLLMNVATPSLTIANYLLGGEPDFPVNSGAAGLFDEVRLRSGSVVQPCFPAPLGLRGVTMMRNMAGCLGLINVMTAGKGMAAHSAYVIWYLRGLGADGKLFLMSDGVGVGYGARPTADGNDAIYLVAQESYPVEFLDAVYPVRVRSYEINRDTGGPGRWRGGCGIVREVEVLAERATVSVRLDAVAFPPWGVSGGMSARPGRCVINPGTPRERVLEPLSDNNAVQRGDVVRVETGGGGGWGHPFDREPERVLRDVLGHFVSSESAEQDYGVCLSADGRSVDEAATAARRGDRPASALFHRGSYVEAFD
jgi:N-methylhydantoinase B